MWFLSRRLVCLASEADVYPLKETNDYSMWNSLTYYEHEIVQCIFIRTGNI